MKVFFLFFVQISISKVCEKYNIRKSWYELSNHEKTVFIETVNKLSNSHFEFDRPSKHDEFSRLHIAEYQKIHWTPYFLPWHRYFLYMYENKLRKINPNVTIPYWDWAMYSQNPNVDPVLEHFGRDGNPNNANCVEDGYFKNMTMYYDNNAKKNIHCLSRSFSGNGKLLPNWTPESISYLIKNTTGDYEQFREDLEAGPHAAIHQNLGLNLFTNITTDICLHNSPNDPLFYLHHAMIDKIYDKWQRNNLKNFYLFDGDRKNMSPFNNVKPTDVFDTQAYPFCYKYTQDSSIDQAVENNFESNSYFDNQKASDENCNSFNELNKEFRNECQSMTKDLFVINPLECSHIQNSTGLISMPTILSKDFINMMHYNYTRVRELESRNAKLIHKLNLKRFNNIKDKLMKENAQKLRSYLRT